jgi:hypothetical protein
MKVLKWAVVSFFILITLVQFYFFLFSNQGVSKSSLLLVMGIVVILLRRERIFWILGLCLFLYGIYNLNFVSVYASSPTLMDFTSSLNFLIYNTKTGAVGRWIIKLIPLIFYPVAVIVFLSKPVQRLYHIRK